MAAINYQKLRQYKQAESVQLIHSGEDFFHTLESLIYSAKKVLHFQNYIYEEDAAGIRIANALRAAAERGVQVEMVIDAFGSKLSKKFLADLRNSGVHFKWFAPFLSREGFHFGRRMHHKVAVADQQVALVGGMNISSRYLPEDGSHPWLDYAVLIRGSACAEVEKICCQIMKRKFSYTLPDNDCPETKLVCIRSNDRLRGKNQIANSYLKEIRRARKCIYILGSYFIPGSRVSRALISAAKRGVKVKIILSGIADVPILGRASRFLYGEFMKNGIELYEWNRSVLHGKIAMIDDKWSTVGSFNLNHLSAFSSIEMNANIMDREFARSMKSHLEDIIASGCDLHTEEVYTKHRTPVQRILNASSYFIIRTCMKSLSVFPKSFFFTNKPATEF